MQTVYGFIKSEENKFQTISVPIVESYEWNMFEHVKLTTLYLNSQYKTGKEDAKPFRNIILPKVNLEHRAVQFDLSEIEFFINSEDEDYKAFLVRKFHERWALQNDVSDFLDKLSETYTDYGGVLIEDMSDGLEVVPFQRLAFCDQTDMMSGPICQKHQYSPDQLKDMEKKGWKNIDEVIALAQEEKANSQTSGGAAGQKAQTPGRYIEVYDLEGVLPESFLSDEGDENKFVRQLQIVTYYTDKNGHKQGITLYSGKKAKSRYKAFKRDEIYGRALGRGAVEELFEPQVWVNYNEIAKTEMLDQASKVLYQTADQSFKSRNSTSDMKNGDVLVYNNGSPLTQVNTTAPNVVAFENSVALWDNQAKEIAAAYDSVMGEQGKSGMPFRLGMLLNQEAHSLHQYRKSRLGIFLTEVYRDWVIPKVQKAVASGSEFLSKLSLDEMGEIVDQVVANQFNKTIIKQVLSGHVVDPANKDELLAAYKAQFFKNNRKFIKILEGELSDLPLEVEVNITSEQKNKALIAEKLSSIFTQITQILIVNPNFFSEHPEMAKLFNQIIEASGLSALNFGMKAPLKPVQPMQPTQPMQPRPLTPPQYAQSQIQGQPQMSGQNVQ